MNFATTSFLRSSRDGLNPAMPKWQSSAAFDRTLTMHRTSVRGFTIIEVMIAIFIFALVLTAIYSTWFGILKGTKSGTTAAAAVQRSRIAMRAIEDAFLTMVMFNDNLKHYWFITEASGDFSGASFVARLPASFPGVGRYGDQIVR